MMIRGRRQWRARGLGVGRGAALFALVLAVEAELAHRFLLIDTVTLAAVLAAAVLGSLVALAAVALAWRAIWRDGDSGFGHSFATLILAVLVLAPFAAAAAVVALGPPGAVTTTDPADPPPLPAREIAAADLSPAGRATPEGRRFPMSTVELYAAARDAANELGWTLRAEDEPDSEGDAGGFVAEARTLVFAVPADVTVRIRSDGDGARVDLSTAFRLGDRDGGLGARRIDAFLAALSDVLRRPAEQ